MSQYPPPPGPHGNHPGQPPYPPQQRPPGPPPGQYPAPGQYPPQRHPAPPPHYYRDFLDGVPLAGWWQRVGAAVLDSLILMVLVIPVTWPWLTGYLGAQRDAREEMQADLAAGDPVDPFASLTAGYEDQVVYTLIGVAIALAYHLVFLRLWQATPGKRIVGIKVRSRDRDGRLSWGTIGKRLALFFLATPLALVPILSLFGALYALLDVLWPLWDRHRQAIHDKWANTSVVRAEPPRPQAGPAPGRPAGF